MYMYMCMCMYMYMYMSMSMSMSMSTSTHRFSCFRSPNFAIAFSRRALDRALRGRGGITGGCTGSWLKANSGISYVTKKTGGPPQQECYSSQGSEGSSDTVTRPGELPPVEMSQTCHFLESP